jgi:hypothetical protein
MNTADFWLPILVSAAFCFVAGAVIWMAMPWHKKDYSKTGDEEAVRAALKGNAPGTYSLPHVKTNAEFQSPEMQEKLKEGPTAFITVMPSGIPTMGGKLVQMFALNLVVAALCAYMLTMTQAQDYLDIYRVTCTTAWIAYGVAYLQESIWFGRPWSLAIKNLVDALIYGLLTGGVFGWLA